MAYHFTQSSEDHPSPPRKEAYKTRMGSPERPKSPGAMLKRSFSTPDTAQLQKQATEDSQGQNMSAGEKKRNKLGYHRTSIACSHCRRRKIRCIASPDVPNRCVNCIRLKKECSFYPVDQQPGTDSRPKAQSRQGGSGPNVSSASSSPAVGTGSPAGTPSAAMGSGITMSGSQVPSSADYFSSDAGGAVSPNGIRRGSQYMFANQPTSGWVSTEVSSTGVSKPEDMAMPWHAYPTESPMSGQFSPYTQTSSASVTWTSGTSEAGSHDEMAWGEFPTPMRSLSYSGESSGSHPQAPFVPMAQAQPYERRQSNFPDMYPPFPATMAGGNPMGAGSNNPTHMLPGATFTPGVNSWQSQHLLSTQGPTAEWQQYGASDGHQVLLMEDQRTAPGVTQAPSSVYYST